MSLPTIYPDAASLRSVLDYDPTTGVFRWKGRGQRVAGKRVSAGYVRITIKGRAYYAHRLAWIMIFGREPENLLDHKNCIRNDNRIANLREASASQNQWNSLKPRGLHSSKFKGVAWHSRKRRWMARIYVDSQPKHLGYYQSETEAALAYSRAAKVHFGEFARAG